MRNSIFISYRRADAGYASSAIHDQLAAHFGRDRVFRDVEALQPGADFAQTISQAVRQSAVCLVIIGPNWLSEENRGGARRIADPNDFIRFEIETAFSQGIPVIPVLVGDAVLPLAVELPKSLRRLSHLNTVVIRSGRELAGTIRYQLIHRNGSAVIEAKRFGAPHAVMLVHSFSPSREWFQDFEAFAKLLRAEVAVNQVVYAGQRAGVHLHIGWICGNEEFLSK